MATSRKNKAISNNLFTPAVLSAIPHFVSMEKFLELLGFTAFEYKSNSFRYYGNRWVSHFENTSNLVLGHLAESRKSEGFRSQVRLVYFESDCTPWVAKAVLTSELSMRTFAYDYNRWDRREFSSRINFDISEWKQENTLSVSASDIFVQRSSELFGILKSMRPYLAEWAVDNCCPYGLALIAPYLETLSKVGYAFVSSFIKHGYHNPLSCTFLSRICQVGTKPKTIFKLPKPVYEALKLDERLGVWDMYRKLVKYGRINPASIQQAHMLNLDERELELAHLILVETYENKPLFSWDSLVNYLHRLDMYEAIVGREALVLLRDYLAMCRKMQIRPRVDSDSLRREHDVTARNYLVISSKQRNERMNAGIHKTWEAMSQLDYKEDIFMVRAIQSAEDLNKEASQQRNCVASYAGRIVKGESWVFVMREVAHPDKSLITIEIDPNTFSIRQKYLARNQPIRNKAQSDFINRWYNYIRKLKAAA